MQTLKKMSELSNFWLQTGLNDILLKQCSQFYNKAFYSTSMSNSLFFKKNNLYKVLCYYKYITLQHRLTAIVP